MLRTSLLALMALTLAACDDEEDTAAVEQEVEVAAAPAPAQEEAGVLESGTDASADQVEVTVVEEDVPAAQETAEELEQVSTTTDSDAAMDRYREWLLGTWGVGGQCDSRVVEMEEGRMTLPGGITCDDLSVDAGGDESLLVAAQSCEGTGSTDPVEIEVTRTGDGVTFTRGERRAELTRCD